MTAQQKKAVIIYPEFLNQDTFWSFNRTFSRCIPKTKSGKPRAILPPLGLMGLCNHLKTHPNQYYNEVVLIDRNVDSRPLELIVADADHVFIGGMIAQEQGFLRDAKIVKQLGKTLIAGGTIVDENSPLMAIADHLVENEAELVIDELLEGLFTGKAKKFYKGKHTPPERFFRPDYSSINMNNYYNMAVQISRGCPEDCEFCDITSRFGRVPRMTPPEYTEASFRQMLELGWKKSVFIVDDNFIGNPSKALEVLANLYEIGEKIGFHHPKITEYTLTLADNTPIMKDIREGLRRANFTSGFIGVETNNVAALKETNKHQNLRGNRSIEEKLRYLSEQTGSSLMAGIIHGFDSDTPESVDELIKFLNSTSISTIMAGCLIAPPHTKLWDRLKREGRLMEKTSGNNSDGIFNFIPYTFSAKQAEQDYVRILEKIYTERSFFTRVMRELELIAPSSTPPEVPWRENLYSVRKILTGENALTFWKHLPQAHKIAKKRFGLLSPGYNYLIAEYFAHCARFTHFKGQTEHLREQQAKREYQPWQLYSWKELRETPIESVEVVQPKQLTDKPSPSLYDKIKVHLRNGYEFVGTRLEALAHSVEPYLQEGLRELEEIGSTISPPLECLMDIEIKAYLKAHLKRPQILGSLDFSKVEEYLRDTVQDQAKYLKEMRHLVNHTLSMLRREPSLSR